MIRRAGWKRLMIAGVLLLAVVGGTGFLLLHRSPAQKVEQAEAAYDGAMAGGAFPFASTMMRVALAANENEPRLWLKLARSELASGSYQGALEAFSRVLDYDPENVEALQGAAELSVAGGNYQDAKDFLKTLNRLQPGDVRGSVVSAAIAVRERRYVDAERAIQALLARGVSTDDLFLLRARMRVAQQDVAGAIKILEARDAATPGSQAILRELAGLYQSAGDNAGLRRTRTRLLAVDPTNVEFQIASAEDQQAAGQGDTARATIDQIQSASPEDADVQLQVVNYWQKVAGRDAALTAVRRAVANGGPAVRIAAAQKLVDLGEPGEAMDLIQPVTGQLGERMGSGAIAAWTVQGNALYALRRLDEAAALADRMLAYDQTNNAALLLRTRLDIDRKELDQGLTDAQLLVRNQPDTLEPLLLLAKVNVLRGEKALADVAYARARDTFPNSLTALRVSISYLVGQGRRAEAGALIGDFLKKHPRSPAARTMVIDICRRTPVPGCVTTRG